MDPLLKAEGIVSGYGEAPILHGVSLEMAAGEFIAVIGPNGAGKSTLIKSIFGLLRLREGRVVFDGQEIGALSPEEIVALGISYVPQVANTFPTLTVRDNLEMGAYLLNFGVAGWITHLRMSASDRVRRILRLRAVRRRYGKLVGKAHVQGRIEAVLDLFPDLRPLLRVRAGKLSGGQQQMVALARGLILEPRVFLIDEPSAGLAPRLVDAIFGRIREIHRAGTGVLLVEQNAKKAMEMADRGYVLEMGRNRFTGPARDLLSNPDVRRLYLGG